MAEKRLDCVVCGSCVVDILIKPVPLDEAIGGGNLLRVEPIGVTTGGIVSNAGTAMARLGMEVAAFSYVGKDAWGDVIRGRYAAEGIDSTHLMTHTTGATSTTAVLIDAKGDRSFAHTVGAPKLLSRMEFEENLELFASSRFVLMGYYPLMPNLLNDLAAVFEMIRGAGCRTALDAAGGGGTMEPLKSILPHLDVYMPSYAEARHQTGEEEPRRIIDRYRSCGAPGVVGVKLGDKGALLSDQDGEYVEVAAVKPPGGVVDTTGAGDSFYGGLLSGLIRGLGIEEAGRLAAATGACCVSGLGASAGLMGYNETSRLAGLK